MNLPCGPSEGKDCTFWIEARCLAETPRDAGFSGRVKLVGFYEDALGAMHKSKPLVFDASHWLKG